jgi:hypothetical protein
MKPRHAAALALVGWYLIVPPGSNPDTVYYKPYSQWKVISTFDSEAACKKTQAEHQGFLYERPLRADRSICIASDDLRLKGK